MASLRRGEIWRFTLWDSSRPGSTSFGLGTENFDELRGERRTEQNVVRSSQHKAHQACLKRLENLLELKTSHRNVNGELISEEEYGRERAAAQGKNPARKPHGEQR